MRCHGVRSSKVKVPNSIIFHSTHVQRVVIGRHVTCQAGEAVVRFCFKPRYEILLTFKVTKIRPTAVFSAAVSRPSR